MYNYKISAKRLLTLLGCLVVIGGVIGGLVYALVASTNGGGGGATDPPVPASAAQTHSPGADSELRPVSVAIDTQAPPVAFHESPQGKAIMRLFTVLSQGKATAGGYEAPSGLWDIMEHNLADRILPSGMKGFYDSVMVKGSWQVIGHPIASAPTTHAHSERGRLVEPRFVYLLVQQGDQYMEAKVQVDFLTYADGRGMVSQAGLAVQELKHLDPALVTKYKAAHGR